MSEVTYKSDTHQYFRGLQELASVTKVIRATWPVKPDYSAADPAVIENARERGSDVDALFSAYVNGTLMAIPVGTRTDVVELFEKLRKWWDRLGVKAHAQVILADDEVAGTCDILMHDPVIWDVKCTYDIEPTYPIQLGMYGVLHEAMYPGVIARLGIVHVTKWFTEPKLIGVAAEAAMNDARIVRQMHALVNRRGGFGK